jgi:hypothetical protein
MPKEFIVAPPAEAFHGTNTPDLLREPIPPFSDSNWCTRVSWDKHDSWMSGGPHLEEGIPYANIVWEQLGLRDRSRANVPDWAKHIRSFDQMVQEIGILFVTDREADAERYGETFKIDLDAEQVLDVIEDPHVRTHNGWIVLIKAGEPFPLLDPPNPGFRR